MITTSLIRSYLSVFAREAEELLASRTALYVKQQAFFSRFMQPDFLAKVSWEEIRQLSFEMQTFHQHPMVGQKALGSPNHSLQTYRNAFIKLFHGAERIEGRINTFISEIKGFHLGATSELLSMVQPDSVSWITEPYRLALNQLGIRISPFQGNNPGAYFLEYQDKIIPVLEAYSTLFPHSQNLPLRIQVDLFLAFVSRQIDPIQSYHEEEPVIAESDLIRWPQYWQLSMAKSLESTGVVRLHLQEENIHELKMGDVIFIYHPESSLLSAGITSGKDAFLIEGSTWQREFHVLFQLPISEISSYFSDPSLRKLHGWPAIRKAILEHKPHFAETLRRLESGVSSLDLLERRETESITYKVKEETPMAVASPQPVYQSPSRPELTYAYANLQKEVLVDKESLQDIWDLWQLKKNLLIQGVPGVGKSFTAQRLAYAMLGYKDSPNLFHLQLHPSYSYEDFMMGFRPDGQGGFQLQKGIFYQVCEKARNHPEQPFVIILEEINRCNLSMVLGEALYLLEVDKRSPEQAVSLLYDTNPFYIPQNVYLIGTMNTADRTISSLDTAIRRRMVSWDLSPQFGEHFQTYLKKAGTPKSLLKAIALRIPDCNLRLREMAEFFSTPYQIGHSYFLPTKGEKLDWDAYVQKIRYEVAPVLREQLVQDVNEAEKMIQYLLTPIK
ncbi:MAG: AAA family ATPase [Bacteroidota bacterium]